LRRACRDDRRIESRSRVGTNGERRNDFRNWHVQVMIDRQVRLRQRMERLYNYDAAAIAI
jgi:hypothetical protein